MRLPVSVLSVLGALTLTVSGSDAAPATAEQAMALKATLERYVGNGGGGNASPVAVTPDGERYAVALDVVRMSRSLEPFGVTLEPATIRFAAQPRDGGLWQVTDAGTTRLTAKVGERTVSVILNGSTFDGLFDPAIPAFTRSTSTYDSLAIAATGDKGATQTRNIQKGAVTYTGTPAGDGVISARTTQTSAESTQEVVVEETPKAAQGALRPFVLKSGAASEGLQFDELRVRSLMELWAFFVAHPSQSSIKDNQEQLRVLLRQALPVFKTWSQSAASDQIAVESALGPFTAKSASLRFDVNGLTAEGRIGSELKLDDLTIPSGLLPAWADGLIPTRIALAESLSGFHLDTVSQAVVNSFDLKADRPFTPAAQDQFTTLIGPLDQMVVTIAPSRFVSALLDLHLEGQVRLKQPVPDVTMTITANGMDEVIKDIQTKGGTDEQAKQLIAVLVLAKGFGKAGPDGALRWELTPDPTGGVLVNGVALPFGQGK